MARTHRFQILFTEEEAQRLKAESERRGIPMSEIVRDYVKNLPKPEKERPKMLHARYNRAHTGLTENRIVKNPHNLDFQAIQRLDEWYRGKPIEIGLTGTDRNNISAKIIKKGQHSDLVDVAAPKDIWDKIRILDVY
jgi:hypothetical protein